MRSLSEDAHTILEQMEPNRGYDASDLMALAGGLNMEAVLDVMHELWIAREVERFHESGWRRTRSATSPATKVPPAPGDGDTRDTRSLRIGAVRPEDLFDHDRFAPWFK